MRSNRLPKFSHYWILGTITLVSAISAIVYVALYVSPSPKKSAPHNDSATVQQPSYRSVMATMFWVGEAADESNAYIPNHESAWVGDWLGEFGGIDDPNSRCGYNPCAFTPKQNAFYVALPFNDIDQNGKAKSADILKKIPWYGGQPKEGESLMKNHWVEIKFGDKLAYGQIEDVGPMYEDDADYVFGTADPKYSKAGIDLSPALTGYLGTNGMATVRWRFVEEADVPAGPWRDTITHSQIIY